LGSASFVDLTLLAMETVAAFIFLREGANHSLGRVVSHGNTFLVGFFASVVSETPFDGRPCATN
jgi:hypothetical protein